MDLDRFDQVAKGLGRFASRRGGIAAALGALVSAAAVPTALGQDGGGNPEAALDPQCKTRRNRPAICPCSANGQCASRRCVERRKDGKGRCAPTKDPGPVGPNGPGGPAGPAGPTGPTGPGGITGRLKRYSGEFTTVTPAQERVFLDATCEREDQIILSGGHTCTDNSGSATGVLVAESLIVESSYRYAVTVRNPNAFNVSCAAHVHCTP